jgi:hypothetical protein
LGIIECYLFGCSVESSIDRIDLSTVFTWREFEFVFTSKSLKPCEDHQGNTQKESDDSSCDELVSLSGRIIDMEILPNNVRWLRCFSCGDLFAKNLQRSISSLIPLI